MAEVPSSSTLPVPVETALSHCLGAGNPPMHVLVSAGSAHDHDPSIHIVSGVIKTAVNPV